jgi:hypothetical protein
MLVQPADTNTTTVLVIQLRYIVGRHQMTATLQSRDEDQQSTTIQLNIRLNRFHLYL